MKIPVTLLLAAMVSVLGSACTKEEQDRIGAIPAQSEMRAEQVEAQQLLRQVAALQGEFHAAHLTFGSSLDEIGVTVPSNSRYQYALTASGSSWQCQATANLDQDATLDTWLVDKDGFVRCTTDDATS